VNVQQWHLAKLSLGYPSPDIPYRGSEPRWRRPLRRGSHFNTTRRDPATWPLNLTRMARDSGVSGLGTGVSESAWGVLGAAWPQPPGTSSQRAATAAHLRHRAGCENSVFFGFNFDFSKLHFLAPDAKCAKLSVQKMMGLIISIGGCAIDRTSECFARME
jgi:hypothetical protein